MKLSVIGAGQMGSGIAQVAAQIAKIPQIILFDQSQSQLNSQFSKIKERFKGAVDGERSLDSIKISTSLNDLKDSDFIIEVVVSELMNLIKNIFRQLAKI